MNRLLITAFLLFAAVTPLYGQEEAFTKDGKKALLHKDGTWTWAKEDSTAKNTATTIPPLKPKATPAPRSTNSGNSNGIQTAVPATQTKQVNTPTKRATSVQCSGRTQKGARCKRMTLAANGRCYQH